MLAKVLGLIVVLASQLYLPGFIHDLGFPDAVVGFSCSESNMNTEFAARWVKYSDDSVMIVTGYGVVRRFPVPIVMFVEEFSGDDQSFVVLVDSDADGYADREYTDVERFIEDWGESFCETLGRVRGL